MASRRGITVTLANDAAGARGSARSGGGQAGRRRGGSFFSQDRDRSADDGKWEHDKYDRTQPSTDGEPAPQSAGDHMPIRLPRNATDENSIMVSNLHFDVLPEDLKTIFREVGQVDDAVIQGDRSGRSVGVAVVTFLDEGDAAYAAQRYNGASINGQKVTVENRLPVQQRPQRRQRGPEVSITLNGRSSSGGGGGKIRRGRGISENGGGGRDRNRDNRDNRRNNGPMGRGRGGRGGKRGGGGGGGGRRARSPAASKEDLDKQLDAYMDE